MFDNAPLSDGLVAVQANAASTVMFVRTVNSGSDPASFPAEIQSAYSCDEEGTPVSDVAKGTIAYFKVEVENNQPVPLGTTLVAVSIFDNDNCPIGFSSAQTTLPAGASSIMLSVVIPSWASSGRATVFATLCTKLPSAGGVPYCVEESGVFTINGVQGENPPVTPSGSQGHYSLSFRVPLNAITTIPYRVYVGSSHNNSQAFSNIPFNVDFGDYREIVSVSITPSQIAQFEIASVQGDLMFDNAPLSDGLVAVQANAASTVMFVRTVNSGSDPASFPAEIQSAYSCDEEGTPVSDVAKGTIAYFKVEVENNQPVPLGTTLVAVSIFDNDNCPIGFSSAQTTLPAGASSIMLSVVIPSWASSGRATVFATLCTKLPSAGGVPYCVEESGVFTINGVQGENPPVTPSGSQGHYSLSFRVPLNAITTIPYRVYVGSSHSGSQAFSEAGFDVIPRGDFNGDDAIDYIDIGLFVDAFINYYSDNPFDPKADFDKNGIIDYVDIGLFVDAFIEYYS
jgi:hypothetical protein